MKFGRLSIVLGGVLFRVFKALSHSFLEPGQNLIVPAKVSPMLLIIGQPKRCVGAEKDEDQLRGPVSETGENWSALSIHNPNV